MFKDVPPELADAVRRFDDGIADLRTRLIRLRATSHAEPDQQDEQRPPADDFDFDHPISSSR